MEKEEIKNIAVRIIEEDETLTDKEFEDFTMAVAENIYNDYMKEQESWVFNAHTEQQIIKWFDDNNEMIEDNFKAHGKPFGIDFSELCEEYETDSLIVDDKLQAEIIIRKYFKQFNWNIINITFDSYENNKWELIYIELQAVQKN